MENQTTKTDAARPDTRRSSPAPGSPRVATAPDCLLNAFDDAKDALMQAEEIMETMGLHLHDIQEALAHLYEARTHLYYDEANAERRHAEGDVK